MYKIVNENLFEFKKGLDPVESLFGIINLGDLIVYNNIFGLNSPHPKLIFIEVITDISKRSNLINTATFIYYSLLNNIIIDNKIYLTSGIANHTRNLTEIRKLNNDETNLIYDNWDLISKEISKFERRINYNNKNIKIRI